MNKDVISAFPKLRVKEKNQEKVIYRTSLEFAGIWEFPITIEHRISWSKNFACACDI